MKRISPIACSIFVLTVLFAMVSGPSRALAQVEGTGVGPKVGLYLDGGDPMVGVIGEIPFSAEVDIEPGLEYVTGITNTTRLIVDGNVLYSFNLSGLTVRPFLLAGLGLLHDSYKISAGADQTKSRTVPLLNIGFGTFFSTRSEIQPWLGFKFGFLGGGTTGGVVLQGGVVFFI